ncbi:MAG TPA: hypothetical protein DIT15_09140 [Arthrobacter bacterium]|jgi:hypothetical protein|nr:hypothetical protein [Arthrobacter sp.]HCN22394.1 hypothetical protein [Arthrobacter sp.]
MAPKWVGSSGRHGIPRADQIHAILNATFEAELEGEAQEGRIMLFIGPAHEQTDRELEILVNDFPDTGKEAVVFHAMTLGPKFKRFREDYQP